ncbi:MFS transporter [Brevibacterium ravenspurgense]|uniref:MFS transporter n=1 Tax=Brevibacterium ravenspurgense TaxID=479117 RepID=UPI001EF278BF|nr:MFS transporter [Brevibacterium ravenspurgense]MCG7299791.1 MFS transporter [Brevibacterium ravenspurgense]
MSQPPASQAHTPPRQYPQSLPTSRVKADRATRKSVRASTVGNILEWYEWSSYAVFAPFIAKVMFDQSDPVSALLATFAVFAVGFLARPLGGFVFGRLADKKGRKFVLLVTMLTMAAGSFAVGIMPTYAAIGIGASVLLLAIRIVQGFAHGGESAAANTYVAEIAPAARRGMWGSIPFIAIFAGSVLAYIVGTVLTTILPDEAVSAWGWRLPFLAGGVLALIVLWMRREMLESEVFESFDDDIPADAVDLARPAASAPEAPAPAPHPVKKHAVWKTVLLIIAFVSGITAAHYTWSSYVSTYAITQHGMQPAQAYLVVCVSQTIALAALPLWGLLSDKIGRKPVLIGFAIGMMVLQFPMMTLISSEPWTLLVASTVSLVIVAMSGALLASVMSEAFPTKYRTQALGFAYSVSVAVFGGSAPYLNALAIDINMAWLSSAYIVALCGATLISVLMMPETKGIDLNDI